MTVALSRFFRFGVPVLVLLTVLGVSPWWLVVLPVIPVWCSFWFAIQRARGNRRIIQRPNCRGMGLEEAAAERRFLYAAARLQEAASQRSDALQALAAVRAAGRVERASRGVRFTGVRRSEADV